MRQFFAELKRRNVLRVAVAYLATAWLLIQINETIFPAFGFSEGLIRSTVILSVIGFPLVLIFSWIYELTPSGLKLEKDLDRADSIAHHTGKKLDRAIIVVLTIAVGYFALDKFVLDPQRDASREQVITQRVRSDARVEAFGENSVAVLQFRNLSDEKERFQYIVDGFKEELVISLNQVPNLNFKRGPKWLDDKTAQVIAKELNVDAIVTGSLRAYGDNLRITAELISATGFQIWAGKFDGVAKNVFELQENVASQVRDAIVGEKGEQLRAASRPANSQAFDTYMRGLFFLGRRDFESLELAQDLFHETIQIDPAFGPAYLRLSTTYLLLSEYDLAQRPEYFDKAIEVAKQGVTADPSVQVPVNMIHGFIFHHSGNWTSAAEAFATAFRGVTVYPVIYQWYSRFLGVVGQLDKSLELALAARAMDPASQVLNSRVAMSYFWINDMVQARHYFEEANRLGVGSPIHNFAYTLFLIRENRIEDARSSAKFALQILQADDWWVDPIFDGLARPDNQQSVDIAFETIGKMISGGLVPPYITMTLWSLFGQPDKAMALAMQVAESNSGVLYEIEIIYLDELQGLREHPAFPELLQALGLTDHWDGIGCRWGSDQLDCDAA
jgi:adenylate cyclase